MIKEALEYLSSLAVLKRAADLNSSDGSGRSWLYNDAKGMYEPVDRFVKRTRTVSNIESFTAMVIEEARRAISDGDFMTVVFKQTGAYFHLDDRDGRQVFQYERELAPQWKFLIGAGTDLEHKDFIRLLQRLRPSIVEYASILQQFRKVSFGSGLKIDSAPTLTEGKAGLQFALELTAANASTKAALPAVIPLKMPYARGSSKLYDVEAEVSIDLDEEDGKKRFVFSLLFPDREVIEEQAVSDEVRWFRENTVTLPKLCILEDY
jgi:hypothetical protein